ncbi:hypothetical protein C8R47DRAFT_1251574 [Mycena vitilis]|nr:hypothetical protein C8R47DRAFT_1251574 [Mycena vitilis]
MWRSLLVLTSIYQFGCLGAGLSNITVDDADPQMIWAWNGDTPEAVHCTGACLANGWDTSKLYNGSVSVTQEDTVAQYRFVALAESGPRDCGIYLFLCTRKCRVYHANALFLVDGDIATQTGNYGILVYSVTGLEDKLHILTISEGPFSFDYLTYTQVSTTQSVVTSTVPQQISPQSGETSTPPPQTSPATPLTSSDLSTPSTPSSSSPGPAKSSSSVLSAFTLSASLALASGDSSLLASATSSTPTTTTSAADSQSERTVRKFPVGAIAGAAVAAVVAVVCLLVALFLCLRARKSTTPLAVGKNEAKPAANEDGAADAITVEDQLRQLQAQVELLRRDPATVRDSAISGTSVARSLSTMKSDQTRAVLGQSYDHSTVRDSYLQTEAGLALRPEVDAGPPRYEPENAG